MLARDEADQRGMREGRGPQAERDPDGGRLERQAGRNDQEEVHDRNRAVGGQTDDRRCQAEGRQHQVARHERNQELQNHARGNQGCHLRHHDVLPRLRLRPDQHEEIPRQQGSDQ